MGKLREVNAIELFLDQALAFCAKQGQIVQAGVGSGSEDGIRFDVWVDGSDDLVRFGELEESTVEPDFDAREVEVG